MHKNIWLQIRKQLLKTIQNQSYNLMQQKLKNCWPLYEMTNKIKLAVTSALVVAEVDDLENLLIWIKYYKRLQNESTLSRSKF